MSAAINVSHIQSGPSAERADMKFEVVVIPVADIDRSKLLYVTLNQTPRIFERQQPSVSSLRVSPSALSRCVALKRISFRVAASGADRSSAKNIP
jgi:hypothetical protein